MSRPTRLDRPVNRIPGYVTYKGMLDRCYNKNDPAYPNYGGRGILVCDRWLGVDGFLNFLSDMGERPNGLSIDRIDNDRGYEPGNCRWATRSQQARNTRKCKLPPLDEAALIEAIKSGLSYRQIRARFFVAFATISSIKRRLQGVNHEEV